MNEEQLDWPTEIRLTEAGRVLKVAFESGASFDLPAEYLRVMSPSAEVQGHSRAERRTIGGKRNILITAVEPVGTYALKLTFDDMHATGIYTWAYLAELGRHQAARWADYLAVLEAHGLSRDRPGEVQAHGHQHHRHDH